MIRFKFTFDKDEEQDWLNDYCQQGWAMVSFFVGLTTFAPCQPGEFIYQIDLLPGSGLQASNYTDYAIFMNDMGVEVLQRWGRWVYLRRPAVDGPFDIYTDVASKIELYRRIRRLFLWVLLVDAFCFSGIIWNTIVSKDVVLRTLAAVTSLMPLMILRGAYRCTAKIRELKQESQGSWNDECCKQESILNLVWAISVIVLGVTSNLMIAAGTSIISLPDGIVWLIGIIELISLFVVTFTSIQMIKGGR